MFKIGCIFLTGSWAYNGVGSYEWGRLSGRLRYMLTIHNWTVHLRLGSWFIRHRHSIDWSVRVICVAGVWTWWWSYQSQKHPGYRALKKCSPVWHLGIFYIWNKKMFVLVQSDFRNGQTGNKKTCNLVCNIAAKRATCTDFVVKSGTTLYFPQQLFATYNNLICYKTSLMVGGKKPNIVIQLVWQNKLHVLFPVLLYLKTNLFGSKWRCETSLPHKFYPVTHEYSR